MKSIKVCEYSRSMSFHEDLILQDQASGEHSQDQWSSSSSASTDSRRAFVSGEKNVHLILQSAFEGLSKNNDYMFRVV